MVSPTQAYIAVFKGLVTLLDEQLGKIHKLHVTPWEGMLFIAVLYYLLIYVTTDIIKQNWGP